MEEQEPQGTSLTPEGRTMSTEKEPQDSSNVAGAEEHSTEPENKNQTSDLLSSMVNPDAGRGQGSMQSLGDEQQAEASMPALEKYKEQEDTTKTSASTAPPAQPFAGAGHEIQEQEPFLTHEEKPLSTNQEPEPQDGIETAPPVQPVAGRKKGLFEMILQRPKSGESMLALETDKEQDDTTETSPSMAPPAQPFAGPGLLHYTGEETPREPLLTREERLLRSTQQEPERQDGIQTKVEKWTRKFISTFRFSQPLDIIQPKPKQEPHPVQPGASWYLEMTASDEEPELAAKSKSDETKTPTLLVHQHFGGGRGEIRFSQPQDTIPVLPFAYADFGLFRYTGEETPRKPLTRVEKLLMGTKPDYGLNPAEEEDSERSAEPEYGNQARHPSSSIAIPRKPGSDWGRGLFRPIHEQSPKELMSSVPSSAEQEEDDPELSEIFAEQQNSSSTSSDEEDPEERNKHPNYNFSEPENSDGSSSPPSSSSSEDEGAANPVLGKLPKIKFRGFKEWKYRGRKFPRDEDVTSRDKGHEGLSQLDVAGCSGLPTQTTK